MPRFLSIYKTVERTSPPSPEEMARMGKLVEDGFKSGFLVATEGCLPTTLGARVRLSQNKFSVTDGPFTEAKEVFGGYAVFELKSKEKAIERSKHFMELHHKHWPGWEEVTEIRQVFGPQNFPKK